MWWVFVGPCFRQRMTSSQCLEHTWLRRKLATPPIESTCTILNGEYSSGLGMTKDNLRMFVERWTEHPNSPYLFDVSTHMISPFMFTAGVHLTSSQQSLRGMSPSPCGSLASSPELIIEHDQFIGSTSSPNSDSLLHNYTFESAPITQIHKSDIEDYQTFERRASDSSCIIRKTDIAERINLAEEIRKLSDKLFKMSTLPDLASAAHRVDSNCINNTITEHPLTSNVQQSEISSMKNSQTCQFKLQEPCRRPKFRITGMNRDVPLNSYNKMSNFVENQSANKCTNSSSAAGTKDLLLKLLDKWDDVQEPVRKPTGRHKSISAEWSEIETLGQRTISSLNTFFQSRAANKKTHPFVTTNEAN